MMKALRRTLASWLWTEIEPKVEEITQPVAYRATDAQLATDTLAEHLGYTIVIDFETGKASIHGLNS